MPNEYGKYGLLMKDFEKIKERDKTCVYCHKNFVSSDAGGDRYDWATIEHLNELPPWNISETVAICCMSCNSSRGRNKLPDWFKKKYCLDKNINEKTVAEPVIEYLRNGKIKL